MSVTRLTLAMIVVLQLAVCPAQAETLKCQRAVARAASQYAQVKTKALSKCEIARIADKLDPPGDDCNQDSTVTAAIGKATSKLDAVIGKACGGASGACGGGDDDSAAALGWASACPGFRTAGTCTNPVGPGCEGISTCLACIDGNGIDNIDLLYQLMLVEDPIVDAALNKCQQTVAKAAHAYLGTKTKVLQKCWDGRMKAGGPPNPCPDVGAPANSPQAKAAVAITKASGKLTTAICKACGGTDGMCGGLADVAPSQINGFAFGLCTGTPETDLQDVIDDMRCLADLHLRCMDAAAVPALTGYPADCPSICGNGIQSVDENCDDGNLAPGDGCSASCFTESGFYCSGHPSVCTTSCGDGYLAGAEACDDQNLNVGDGCDASCTVEVGYTCSGQPSVCVPV